MFKFKLKWVFHTQSGGEKTTMGMAKSLRLLGLALALGGCSVPAPQPADTIRIGIRENPSTLDPALIADVPSGRLVPKLFNGLVRYGDSLEVLPDIARSWTVSPDGTTYTFFLRSGVVFSSGRPVTADDFKYSFERVLSPAVRSPRLWVFEAVRGARAFSLGGAPDVAGIRARDAATLVIELERPFTPFLSMLGMPTACVVDREQVEKTGRGFGQQPVGTGPYRLESWDADNQIVLVRNDRYFGPKPKTQRLVYRVFTEEFSMRTEFEAGNLDIIPLSRTLLAEYRASPRYGKHIAQTQGANTYYVGFNCRRAPFDQPALRQALNRCIERDKIVQTILGGTAVPARGPVPPLLTRYAAEMPVWTYDPSGARAAIQKLSDPPGDKEYSFYIRSSEESLSIAQVLQYYFRQAGVRVHIVACEWSAFKKACDEGVPDLFLMSWWADYPVPENFLYPTFFSGNAGPAGNRAQFSDPMYDEIILQAQRTADADMLQSLYKRAELYLIDRCPWIFLWHRSDYAAVQPDIRGFRLNPLHGMDSGVDMVREGPPEKKT